MTVTPFPGLGDRVQSLTPWPSRARIVTVAVR